jgi:hypothetical protein
MSIEVPKLTPTLSAEPEDGPRWIPSTFLVLLNTLHDEHQNDILGLVIINKIFYLNHLNMMSPHEKELHERTHGQTHPKIFLIPKKYGQFDQKLFA